jgi:hypothetical protein
LYATAKVLPGNIIEIQAPDLTVGETVEVIILRQEVSSHSSPPEECSPSLKQRLAFLKLPMSERRHILESQKAKGGISMFGIVIGGVNGANVVEIEEDSGELFG